MDEFAEMWSDEAPVAIVIEPENPDVGESSPMLSKEENPTDDVLEKDPQIASASYGTFSTHGPDVLTLSKRREILKKQQTRFRELQLSLRKPESISSKFAGSVSISLKRAKSFQKSFRVFGESIKKIEGQLGSGVCTYFKVLVWLLKINFLCMILGLGLIVGPGVYMNHNNYEIENSTVYNKDDLVCTNPNFVNASSVYVDAANSLLQFLTGTGWMESTPMFYGWYPTGNLTSGTEGGGKTVCYFSLAYFSVGVSSFFLALLFMLFNLSAQFNKSAAEQFDSKPYATQILTLDYSISNKKTSQRQSVRVVQALREKLIEDAQGGIERDFWTKVKIFLLRVVTNTICLAGMVGSVYIYVYKIITESSEEWANSTDSCGHIRNEALEDLEDKDITEQLSTFWSTYSASIIVSASNVILPNFFKKIGSFEKYRFQSTRVGITLLRMFTMKLFNISAYLYILLIAVGPSGGQQEPWQNHDNTLFYNCWENHIASQLYQLLLVDFIVFCITLLLSEVLRSYLLARSSFLRDRLGITKPEFDIAQEILDLVHKQMIIWSGFYFAPLFPVLAVLEVLSIFYLKKASALSNVIPPQTVVLNHQSTFTINCLFLISLLVVFVFMGLVIFNYHPSSTCGPFRDYSRFTDPLSNIVDHSGVFKKYIVDNIKTTSILVILVILTGLVIYYYRSLAASRAVTITLLTKQVRSEITEKQALLDLVPGHKERRESRAQVEGGDGGKAKKRRKVSTIL